MQRPLGPALLSIAVAGCYHGLDETDPTTTLTSATTADPHVDPTTVDDGDAPHEPRTTDVSLTVVDRDGQPIAGARVHHDIDDVADVARVHADPHVHLTAADGHLVLTGYRGPRAVILVDGDDWAPATAVVDLVPDRVVEARVTLLRRDRSDPNIFKNFVAEHGVTDLDFGPVRVTIPPDALVDAGTGEPVRGPVSLSVVPIDPTTDLVATPGPLRGRARDGRIVRMRTLFMADVSVWQDGRPLQLGGDPDHDATLRFQIPGSLADRHLPGAEIPAWYYDFAAGLWIEDLDVEPVALADDGTWIVDVPHFTPWNADVPIDELGCVRVTACLDDMCTEFVPYIPVTAEGPDYVVTELTGEDGTACLEVPALLAPTPDDIVYLGLHGQKLSPHKQLPATDGVSCGAPADCAQLSLKYDAPPMCSDGDQQECVYEGPPVTDGVGTCSAPRRTCQDNAYGLCEGGHTPDPGGYDACGGFDTDCDGYYEPHLLCLCTVNAALPCYDFPSEHHLLAPDVCTVGEIACVDGLPPGPCEMAKPPAMSEDDLTPEDDNCDGATDAFGGNKLASVVYRGVDETCGQQQVWDVVATADKVYIAGTFTGSIDLGPGCVLSNASEQTKDQFVARLDPNLNCEVARRLDVSAAPGDGVHLARSANGTIALLGACGRDDARVTDADNNTLLPLAGCPDDPHVLLVFFTPDLAPTAHTLLGVDDDNMSGFNVDARALAYAGALDEFVVTGGFSRLTHGPDVHDSAAARDIFLATYAPTGAPAQFHAFGAATQPDSVARATALATAGTRLLLAGSFTSGLFLDDAHQYVHEAGTFVASFATGDLAAPTALLRLSAVDGALAVHDLVLDPDPANDSLVVGEFDQNVIINANGEPTVNLLHTGGGDGFLLPVDAALAPRQPLVYRGGDTSQLVRRVALDSQSQPRVLGDFTVQLDVPPLHATDDGLRDAFLVRHLGGSWDPLWIWRPAPAAGVHVHGRGLALDADDRAYVVGLVDGTSDLGDKGKCSDGFIAKIGK